MFPYYYKATRPSESSPSYSNLKGTDRQTIRRQRASLATQFLQSKQTSNKIANRFEKSVESTDLFVVGYQLRYRLVSRAK